MKTAAEILHEHGIAPPPPGKQRYYTTCPQCSANRSRAHQKTACLGVTVKGDGVTWGCNHCLWTGGGYFNGKINGPGGEPARTYDYLDEQGKLLFQKVRNPPGSMQRFWQRRPDGKGGWINNTQGVRKVLYRLPELLEAIASERTILVVEGEKDSDSLWRIGVPATCSPDGASDIRKAAKWRMAYSKSLGGADLVVIPDHDTAGYAHASATAKASVPVAKRVRMLTLAKHWPECPKGGDVSDWLAAGHTREQLGALIDRAPDHGRVGGRPRGVTWDNRHSPKPDWLAGGGSAASDQGSKLPEPEWPTMGDDAYHGLTGEVVHTIEPHTEADPVAILIQFLACAGNIIGRCPYHQIEGDQHHANLFTVLVGESSKARKGTSWGRIASFAKLADEHWYDERTKGGLSSGEGLINEVRDERKEWNKKEGREEVVDDGVRDKRLMVSEPEFAGVLAVAERHGNTLSPLMRKAWDGGILSTMTRTAPLRATSAHISIVGHITVDELRARLTRTDTANGFANRFLFMLVRRSRLLPFGGDTLDETVIAELGRRLQKAVEAAASIGRVGWTTSAANAWKTVYPQLSKGQPGLLGAVTSRAEAQCVRLALIYALLDDASKIDLPHIKAALAVWEYAEASAANIFGASLGDPVADDIYRALQHAGREGMSRTAIRDLFARNQSADRIGAALGLLATRGRAKMEIRQSGGRPTECWIAMEACRHG